MRTLTDLLSAKLENQFSKCLNSNMKTTAIFQTICRHRQKFHRILFFVYLHIVSVCKSIVLNCGAQTKSTEIGKWKKIRIRSSQQMLSM